MINNITNIIIQAWFNIFIIRGFNLYRGIFFKPILCEGTGMSSKYFQHSEKTTFNLRGSSKTKRVLRATDFMFKNRWTNIDEDNVADTIRRRDTHWYGSLNDSAVDPTQFKADCYLLHNYLLFIKKMS